MPYVTSNPPLLVRHAVGSSGQTYSYKSADAAATVAALNYFTNAAALGMRVNDLVEVTNTAGNIVTMHRVAAVNYTKATVGGVLPGAADLADGTPVGVATNT